ncbi:hypothetical protein CN918_29490 [Priestia megaterium]|nr:hypothetical protein CN918_29490 [Priestia megaterium]
MIYPFVPKPGKLSQNENSHVDKLYKALKSKGSYTKLNEEEKELISSVFNELWSPETYQNGIYRLGGWTYNFSEFLTQYIVDSEDHGLRYIKAFSVEWILKNEVKDEFDESRITAIYKVPSNELEVTS